MLITQLQVIIVDNPPNIFEHFLFFLLICLHEALCLNLVQISDSFALDLLAWGGQINFEHLALALFLFFHVFFVCKFILLKLSLLFFFPDALFFE